MRDRTVSNPKSASDAHDVDSLFRLLKQDIKPVWTMLKAVYHDDDLFPQ